MAQGAAPEWLNYLHLKRFWIIARERSLTKAAKLLRVSQSTLSEQVSELEEWLGQPLFERRGRGLELTDAGRIALGHAETIFQTGQDLLDELRRGKSRSIPPLRIGAVGPLSKNLQFDFIQPLIARRDVRVSVAAGSFDDLLLRLGSRELDVVLSNMPPRMDMQSEVFSHLLGEMPVYLTGTMALPAKRGQFPQWLEGVPLFLPSRQSHVRSDFDLLLEEAGVKPDVRAEVDDMALLRLLALSGQGLALVPAIVVKHELKSKRLKSAFRVPGLSERFYAITSKRRFGAGWLAETVTRFREGLAALNR